jgi:hypothetical protein
MRPSTNSDIHLSLKLSQSPTYVHPPRTLTSGPSASASLDKVLTGDLTITTGRQICVGRIKVVWELGHHPNGGERVVISRFVSDVTEEDLLLEQGVLE